FVRLSLGLVRADTLFNLKALELTGGGARQIVLPDFIAADALGGGELRGQSLDIKANDFLRVYDLAFFEGLEVGNDDRVQSLGSEVARPCLKTQHTDFFYVGRFLVVRLDLFRINVFSVAKNDDVFLTASDEKISRRVEVAKVASMEPAIFENSGSGVGTIPVALHYDGAADKD